MRLEAHACEAPLDEPLELCHLVCAKQTHALAAGVAQGVLRSLRGDGELTQELGDDGSCFRVSSALFLALRERAGEGRGQMTDHVVSEWVAFVWGTMVKSPRAC